MNWLLQKEPGRYQYIVFFIILVGGYLIIKFITHEKTYRKN